MPEPYSEIRKLAEAAKSDPYTFGSNTEAGRNFIAAANPKAVLELLDEIDRLRAVLGTIMRNAKAEVSPSDSPSQQPA